MTGGKPVEPRPYAVESMYVIVEGSNKAHHRARSIPSHESLRADPLQPGDILTSNGTSTLLAVVERVTQGHRDGCRYKLLEFQRIDPQS
jgi:hypothetical protein